MILFPRPRKAHKKDEPLMKYEFLGFVSTSYQSPSGPGAAVWALVINIKGEVEIVGTNILVVDDVMMNQLPLS